MKNSMNRRSFFGATFSVVCGWVARRLLRARSLTRNEQITREVLADFEAHGEVRL